MSNEVILHQNEYNALRDELIRQADNWLTNTDLLDEVDVASALTAASERFVDNFTNEQRSWWEEMHSV